MKQLFFISGLPKSGSYLLSNILKQNKTLHINSHSSLSSLVGELNYSWNNLVDIDKNDKDLKKNVLDGIINSYYKNYDNKIVIDRDFRWVELLPLSQQLLVQPIKIIVCVRNPVEILASLEKSYNENPMNISEKNFLHVGKNLPERISIYTNPSNGVLGKYYANLMDCLTTGNQHNLLFVDYSKFCNMPKTSMKRIYEFLELEYYEHDFENILLEETNTTVKLEKRTYNPVKYIGLPLFEEFNGKEFWNALI